MKDEVLPKLRLLKFMVPRPPLKLPIARLPVETVVAPTVPTPARVPALEVTATVELFPLKAKVPAPSLVMLPLVMLPLNAAPLPDAVVRVRAAPPRSASALKMTVPVFVASPKVTLPPMVTAFRIVRLFAPAEESWPPLRAREPVPIALLVIAPTVPTLATSIWRVPAVRVVPPL